jgi:chaperonin GroEL
MNTVRGTLKVAAVKAPRYGQERKNILRDLALSIGATYVSRNSGVKLKDVKLEHLGSAKTIEILKSATTIVDGAGDVQAVEGAIEALKVEVEQTESLRECELIQERITRLASGIAIIRVGAPTEIEMMEKKHRVEDALEAVRSAQQEGIVPGGGATLLKLAAALEAVGENDDQNFGYNFASGQVVDLLDKGIVDPAKVVRCALQNAASASSTLLTTNYCIIER